MSEERSDAAVVGLRLVLPVALVAATLLILSGFSLYQAISERSVLLVTLGAQEQPIQQAEKVKAQLDSLASATAKLAEQGNAGAKSIIDELRREGIQVRQ